MANRFIETIFINKNTIKSQFDNVEDFKTYWEKYSKKRFEKYDMIFSKKEQKDIIARTVESITKDFIISDKIIHYDNFNEAPERCGREFVLLVNGNNIKKSVLIRMS